MKRFNEDKSVAQKKKKFKKIKQKKAKSEIIMRVRKWWMMSLLS